MALPAIPLIAAGLRTAAATLLRSSRARTGIASAGLKVLGQGVSTLAKMSPVNQLLVGGLGLATAGSMVKQSNLNAEVRKYAPTNSGW